MTAFQISVEVQGASDTQAPRKWSPRLHLPPGDASLQPELMLYGQQMRWPSTTDRLAEFSLPKRHRGVPTSGQMALVIQSPPDLKRVLTHRIPILGLG